MPDAPQQPRFIDGYLSYLLARASHAVYKEFESTVNDAGLSSLEWRVLATLADGDGMGIGDLAREVIAKQPTLTKLVQRMEDAGWVSCGADPGDARRTVVRATRKGRTVVARLIDAAKAHETDTLAGFGAQEVATLKKILRTLIGRAGA
jgi:DNA-binding MarR family transcriptional regulator